MHPSVNIAPKLLSVREVTGILGITHQTVYKLVDTKKLKGVKIGKEWRIYDESLQEYLRVNTHGVETAFIALLTVVFPIADSIHKQVLDLRYNEQLSVADITHQIQKSASETEELISTALGMLKVAVTTGLTFKDVEWDHYALRVIADLYFTTAATRI